MNNIPQKEGQTVEFKSSFNEEVVETLTAFANAKGGTVYIGISDKGALRGITVGKETIPNWINEIKSKTSPQIISDTEIYRIDNKTVVSLSVSEYPIKPVSTRGKFFKRVSSAKKHCIIQK